MKVLFAASEMVPYAMTGGLADVAKALPEALARQGVEIIRAIPCYRQVAELANGLADTGLRFQIPVGLNTFTAEIWTDETSHPQTYFIRRDEFFDRTHLYGLPNRDYDDNFERFAFFQKAIVALIDHLGLRPEIVHANDWQTGLLPLFLRHGLHASGRNQTEKTVFTIHNLAYQGIFPSSSFALSNLPFSCFNVYELEYYSQMNCMKPGIVVSQYTTTVSPTYAREICTPENGCGLEGVLLDKGDRLLGILNGVNYDDWNPGTDPYLAATFGPDDLDGKTTCKQDLLRTMGLDPLQERPLIGIVSRLAEQKGFDILAPAMEAIMQHDVAIALLGTGQPLYHDLCLEWTRRWKGRFSARLEYNTALAHQIEAGSDIFLMPSRYEPCGLNQLYSLKYGTIPIVHATGGLQDSIQEIDTGTDTGNGFSFDVYTPEALLDTIKRALSFCTKQPLACARVRQRIMRENYSWDKAASEYIQVYEKALQS